MRLNIFFLSFFLASLLNAQDDLQLLYEKAESFVSNPMTHDSAAHYYVQLDSLATIVDDRKKVRLARIFLSSHYRMKGRTEQSLFYAKNLLPYCTSPEDSLRTMRDAASAYTNESPGMADSIYQAAVAYINWRDIPDAQDEASLYLNYATFLQSTGDYVEAVKYYELGLSYDLNDLLRLTALRNLVVTLITTENWTQAEEYILEALDIAERNNYGARNDLLAVDYGRLLMRKGDYEQAEIEIRKAITYHREKGKDTHLTYSINSLMDILVRDDRWTAYETYLSELNAITKNKQPGVRSRFFSRQLNFLWYKKEYENVLIAADSLMELSQETRLPVQAQKALDFQAKAYTGLGQYKKAYELKVQAESLADSIYISGQSQFVAGVEAKFKRKEQDLQISSLDEKNQSQKELLRQQKRTIIGGGIALLLISLLSFLLFRYLKQINEQKKIISKALLEKDTLLREIHHRVKNNLQLVSSLLTLQGRSITDETALQAITDGKARVRSMALIHQDLYKKENLTGIDLREYLEKLTHELVQTYAVDRSQISLKMNIDEMILDIDTVVPLGLIINELITNSLKYAFPENRKGEIVVAVNEEADLLVLEVSDNGIGKVEGENVDASFGNTLIKALARQLDAQVEISSVEGLGLSGKVKIKDYKIISK